MVAWAQGGGAGRRSGGDQFARGLAHIGGDRVGGPGAREILAKMPESAPLTGLGAGGKKVASQLNCMERLGMISSRTGRWHSVRLGS